MVSALHTSGTKKVSSEISGVHAIDGSNAPTNSLETFSVSPFHSVQDSTFHIASFVTQYAQTVKEKDKIWDMTVKYNDLLTPPLEKASLLAVFNKTLDIKVTFAPSMSFSELMRQEFPKARYAVEPFFEAGTVNMVSAPPNTWKSWLLFYFSAHIARGTEALGKFPTEQSKVMIVNEEDSFRAIQDRFRILNITDDSLEMYFRVANGSKLETKFIDKLLEELKEKQIGVVIFDSLRAMHEADENDSTAMQRILDQMKRISREGITVIFTHHHRKKGPFEKGSGSESSRGSSAINAAISGHISLEEEERESGLYLIIRHLKSKAGEKMQPFEVKIVKDEQSGTLSFVYDGEFKQGEKKVTQTKDSVMAILQEGGWKTKKDFEPIGVGKNVLTQALQGLKNQGVILSFNRREAIKKHIPVTAKGNANEMYYSLNTEVNESIIVNGEIDAEQAFMDY